MRRFILYALTGLLLAITLAGCVKADNQEKEKPDGKISVVATIFAPYDFVREIAGDKADITMLLPPGSEIHSYEPAPQDIIKIRDCDVFIYVGGESDDWVRRILGSMDTANMRIIALMDCVDAVTEEILPGMEDDDEFDMGAAYDEHVWTSPENAGQIVLRISDILCEADEANALAYKENTDNYLEKLKELDMAFRTVADEAVRKTVVFGDRFPFRYFADAYGLECFAAFPGCSGETEPSAATVAFLIDKVKEEGIPVVFHTESSNGNMAATISEASGAKVMLLHSCHNVSRDDFKNGISYLQLMTQNVDALKKALY